MHIALLLLWLLQGKKTTQTHLFNKILRVDFPHHFISSCSSRCLLFTAPMHRSLSFFEISKEKSSYAERRRFCTQYVGNHHQVQYIFTRYYYHVLLLNLWNGTSKMIRKRRRWHRITKKKKWNEDRKTNIFQRKLLLNKHQAAGAFNDERNHFG